MSSRRCRSQLARAFQATVVVLLFAPALAARQLPTAIPQTKFASGQDVVPYFEGWIRNTDGSFDLVFGYFNRNWEQSLVIPAGADNLVEPGGPDRGQPTFFGPRRQGWVYRVRVPGDFGRQVLTWTIRANGRTEKAYGELLPVEEITERIVMTRGNLNPGEDDPNRPPTIAVAPATSASVAEAVTLVADVTDDGLPKPRAATPKANVSDATRIQAQANSSAPARPRGLNVTWMQLRGPAKIAFEPSGPIAVVGGKASTTARFAEPGTYVVRATANDGALSTKTDVTIAVVSATQTASATAPAIDNARVTVWETRSIALRPEGDSVWISIERPGEASYRAKGARQDPPGTGRGVVIALKDARVAPLGNTSGYPNAFPRPGVRKLLENDRVIVWDYTWTPGQPTPMHFHDKDVVVTYVAEGALKSTTPDGKSTMNEFSQGAIRYNSRDRVHTEEIARGAPRAIITELK
jgi:hypothetical protein